MKHSYEEQSCNEQQYTEQEHMEEQDASDSSSALLRDEKIFCPYCGESIHIVIDVSEPEQEYIEDCSVCCRPITLVLSPSIDDGIDVAVYTGDDVV